MNLSPIVKILARKTVDYECLTSFFAISRDKILFKSAFHNHLVVCLAHPEGKNWTSVATLSPDEELLAVCDCEKALHIYKIDSLDPRILTLIGVPMRLAKTATSVKFTAYPSEWTILVADKFGDVLRFQIGEEFERWARESQQNAKSLSIHSKSRGKRSAGEVTITEEINEDTSSEAHHCTIMGHISMITDLQVLSISPPTGGLIVTCDRDEKVRLTRADRPEIIHSFGLGHREFVGTLAVNDANSCIYSGGGDDYIIEWKVEGDVLRLVEKIALKKDVEGVVQEIKVDSKGENLFVHVDGFGILHYTKKRSENGGSSWCLEGSHWISGLTAFDIDLDRFFAVSWTPERNIVFHNVSVIIDLDDEDLIYSSVEAAVEVFNSLSKSKLRKDVERMDWKQKKHSNQKPRG